MCALMQLTITIQCPWAGIAIVPINQPLDASLNAIVPIYKSVDPGLNTTKVSIFSYYLLRLMRFCLYLAHPAHAELVHRRMYLVSCFQCYCWTNSSKSSLAKTSHNNWVPFGVLNNCLLISTKTHDLDLDKLSSTIKYPRCLFNNNVCISALHLILSWY